MGEKPNTKRHGRKTSCHRIIDEGMNFESATDIERKRQEVREARQIYLEKAKQDFERDERKKERAKQGVDDRWMLDSVNDRVKAEEKNLEKMKKKKKGKNSRTKKNKKDRKESSSSDSSSKDDSNRKKHKKKMKSDSKEYEPQWIEKSGNKKKEAVIASSAVKGPKMQRESWMSDPLDLIPTITRKDVIDKKNKEKEEFDRQRNLLNMPGTHARELNPYWKDGGSGLPNEKSDVKDGSTGIGDAGLSWLRKSYQRCVEQAKEEGRSLEELAAERWGSLEKIQSMLRSSEPSTDRLHSRARFMQPRDSENSVKCLNTYRRSRSRSPSHRSRDTKHRSRTPERYRHRSRSRDKYKNVSQSSDRSPRSQSPEKNRSSTYNSSKRQFIKPGDKADNSYQWLQSDSTRNNQMPAWKKKTFQNSGTELEDKDTSSKKPSVRNEHESGRRRASSSSESSSSASSTSESSSDLESDKGQQSRTQQSAVQILSEKEMNELGAKILKAEIMGNEDQAAKLKAQLEAAREAKKNVPANNSNPQTHNRKDDDEFVTLTRTDKSGLTRPVSTSEHVTQSHGGKRRTKQKVETHTGRHGERLRYFGDDDKYDLKTLVEREKMSTAEDQNQMFARLAGRTAQKTDDDFQIDDVFLDKANRKQSESIEEQRDRAAAIFEHKKMATSLDRCNFCFGNVPKHLIIAIGTKVYLCLPSCQSLTEGHCLIVPMQHTASSTAMDEDVWSEVQAFRSSLTQMFAARDNDVVFMETSMRLKHFPHGCIECIPMDKEIGDMAPVYFKKAIQESETDWSQNKKLIDLSRKNIRYAVPKGFPYFAVDFGNDGGFAHVIEDELKFPTYFGKEIIGGMIDCDHRLWKKPFKENFEEQRKKVLHFAEMWKPFDWTLNISKQIEVDSSSDSD